MYQTGQSLPFFAGREIQKGHGLLSTIGKFALPILKNVGRTFAPQVIDSGCSFAKDKVKNMMGEGYKRKRTKRKKSVRRKTSKKAVKPRKKKQPSRKKKSKDIFD